MIYNVGQYIGKLLVSSGMTQADVAREIRVSRQSLNLVICGKRDLSLQMAMKLEAFFSLPTGELMKMQAMQTVLAKKKEIRQHLCEALIATNAFWSYDAKNPEEIPDELIIEQCFRMLDMDDIDLMFELYPRNKIWKVWKEQMAIQGDYLRRLNLMIAMYYFGIKKPEKFLEKTEKNHLNKILRNAPRIDGIY